jgi:hypothetical protein
VPAIVKDLIQMLLEASIKIVTREFPKRLQALSDIAKDCSAKGKACQDDFRTLCGLAGMPLFI